MPSSEAAETSHERRPPPRGRELAVLALVLLAIGVGEAVRLESVVYSDADEGTYVYAGKLLAEGKAPYRDFMLAHPPLLPALVAVAWTIDPSIMMVRLFFIGLNLLGGAGLYLLARAIVRKPMLALLIVALTFLGMLCVANMGRTVRLEPTVSLFLLLGAACLRIRSRRQVWTIVAGVLLAAACLVKLVAVVPIFLLLVGDLAWPHPDDTRRSAMKAWAHVALGAAIVLGPAAIWLARSDGFIKWVVEAQAIRPSDTMEWRLDALRQSFVRWPPLPLGLVAAGLLLIRGNRLTRPIALVTLGTTVAIAFGFKSYATYYVALVVPWASLALVAWLAPRLDALAPVAWRYVQLAGVFVLGCLGPLAFSEVYHRYARSHTADAGRVLTVLSRDRGKLYSMAPDFNLFSGRSLPDWYFTVDSYLARLVGRVGDDQFAVMVNDVEGLLLYPGEFRKFPKTMARLSAEFEKVDVGTPDWEFWRRRQDAGRKTASPPVQ